MKKIILLILLLLNIGIVIKNSTVKITTIQTVCAQQRIDCPSNPTRVDGSSFWNWLSNQFKAVSSTITKIASSISNFFAGLGGNGGGDSMGDEGYNDGGNNYGYDNSSFDSFEPSESYQDPWYDPTFDNDGWTVQAFGVANNLTNYSNVYNQSNIPDTVKPTPKPCDSSATKRNSVATKMLNDIATSPELKRTRDSSQGNHEVSFSTYDSSGNTRVVPNSFRVGDTAKVDQTMKDSTTGPNHKNFNAVCHLHEKGIDPFPDAADVYNLLKNRTIENPYLNYSFIICGDTLIDLAIVMTDTMAAIKFMNLNPHDSVVNMDSMGPFYREYNAQHYNNNNTGILQDRLTLAAQWDNAVKTLRKAHYPEKMLWTYAGAYIMQKQNMGVKTLIKVNGQFKELSVDYTLKRNEEIKTIKIKICDL